MPALPLLAAQPICPAVSAQWPEGRETALYWMVRRRVEVDARGLGATLWRVAADRHFWLFINGERVARQLNYFSGDRYLLGQEYGDAWTRHLRPGMNEVIAVVRSDPWSCKNYRPFYPSFWLESLDRDGAPWLWTDGYWETAVVEGWRNHLFLSTTQLYEQVRLAPGGQAGMGGVPLSGAAFAPASALPPGDGMPAVYVWTDPPAESVVRVPEVAAAGPCRLPREALHFDLSGAFAAGAHRLTLTCPFEADRTGTLAVAATAIRRYRLRLNGTDIGGNHSEPVYDHYTPKHAPLPEPRHAAGHYHYIRLAGRGLTRAGRNTLEIEIEKSSGWNWDDFRLSAVGAGADALMSSTQWRCNGNRLTPTRTELSLSDRMSALLLPGENERGASGGESPEVVLPASTRPQTVLLDFGCLTNSFLSFTVRASSPGRLTLAYGRVRNEAAVDCACMDRRTVDVLDVPAGVSHFETMEWRHFRYLSILAEECEGPIALSGIRAEESVYLPWRDIDFVSDDGRIDRMWRASLRTAQLCGHAIYMDNPDREQAQWIDNTTPNQAAGYYWFGETRRPAKVLWETILHQFDDGQIQGYAPGLWHPGVPPYQCHLGLFAQACRNHFFCTGDREIGHTCLDALLRLLNFWRGYRRSDGLIHELHTVFVDWGSHFYSYAPALHDRRRPPTGALTSMNAYALGGLRAGADMARWLGRGTLTDDLTAEADAAADAIRRSLWDSGRGLFRDGIDNPEAEAHISQTANALAVWFGAAPSGAEAAIMERCFGRAAPPDIIRAGPHFTYQAGSALFESGCGERALDWLRAIYGPMTAAGSDTLWESRDGTISRCQGTGAAVAYLLGRYVAGLYPAEPGFAAIGCNPQPAGLRRLHARLRMLPGPLTIDWEIDQDDRMQFQLGLPHAWRNRRLVHPPRDTAMVTKILDE